jgi:glycosyltransferase involved in cell wall biosynthesis
MMSRMLQICMNSEDNHEVSIVILTKNSIRTVKSCLKSVVREGPGEILAVDTLSTDGTLKILKDYGVKILSDASESMGYLRQLGINATKGRYVAFVDSDVELSPGCIATLRRELERRGLSGINAKILSARNESYWQRAEDQMYSMQYGGKPVEHMYWLDHVALFKRHVLIEYPYDPWLVESSEDRDLCQRLAKAKLRVGQSTATAYHHHEREIQSFIRHRFRYGLGDARLGVKYREVRILYEPLTVACHESLLGLAIGSLNLIPYWLLGGISEFFGVLIGLPVAIRERRQYLARKRSISQTIRNDTSTCSHRTTRKN